MLPCAKVNSEMPGMPPVSTVQPVPLGQRLGINAAMYSLPAHYLHTLQPSTLHTPSNTFSCISMKIIVLLLRLPHLFSCPDWSHYSSNSFVPATVFGVICFALGFYSALSSLIHSLQINMSMGTSQENKLGRVSNTVLRLWYINSMSTGKSKF